MIYLDYAATTQMSTTALKIYTEIAENYFGNSQSLHDYGTATNDFIHLCQRQLANLINGDKEGVFFTSGGSEGNILALSTLIHSRKKNGNHIITTPLEHSSLRNYFETLSKHGFDITYVEVDKDGMLSLESLEKQIRPTTIVASIGHCNSEFGTLQPLKEIGCILHKKNVLFHTDTVQTFGKIPINVQHCHIDSLTISSHKIYGPKGVGACYISPKINWQPLILGTTHQAGFRPGTLDTPGIGAFVHAAIDMENNRESITSYLTELKTYFLDEIQKQQLPVKVIGSKINATPHIIGLCVQGVEGQHILLEANRHGFAISTGSACAIGLQEPSPSLLALGLTKEEAKGFIRISIGKQTTKEQLQTFIEALKKWTSAFKGVTTI
ncbi:MAG: IscS subfamily cysteine desulfurase [Bacillaceae bacterium]